MSRTTHPKTTSASRSVRAAQPVSSVNRSGRPDELVFGGLDHILFVLKILEEIYGFGKLPPDEFATGEPLDGLLLTLLSQNTNDRNRDIAYGALRAKHPSWEDVAALPASAIAGLIRPAGLGGTKAARMKVILEKIFSDFGAYSLSDMLSWGPREAREYLSALPGIGPKTVACVLAFDLDMPAFPVDTHVARISRRMGWADEKASPEKIQDFLEATVPPEFCRGGHLDMIEHGRKICRARKPECGACAVQTACKCAVILCEGV